MHTLFDNYLLIFEYINLKDLMALTINLSKYLSIFQFHLQSIEYHNYFINYYDVFVIVHFPIKSCQMYFFLILSSLPLFMQDVDNLDTIEEEIIVL